ncbi:hypothetical protein BH160DRAFT_7149 [Burkholderia sp. H160]|nr:hypothetical protein BH160DRAFT_7149 [Burkholderia sp. H160]
MVAKPTANVQTEGEDTTWNEHGFGIVAMIVSLGLCGVGMIIDRSGRRTDRERAHRGRPHHGE